MAFASCTYRFVSSLCILTLILSTLALVAADGPNGEQCGPKDSGAICGLNTCCSAGGFCGTTSAYCDAGNGCQSAYGSCSVPTVPSCSSTSASSGRRVGYYQSAAASGRACEDIAPSQINSTGLTHLVFAFAGFDSSSFAIAPAQPGDTSLYSKFTSLQTSTLQTWISVGGGGFSTAAWSAMTSSSGSRGAFISSLQSFLQQYSFQGVDLDWEFPNASGADAQNLVALVREMRAALGGTYGISATLPADWGSVRGFDPAGMATAGLDFFNYMAYDVHGWGVDSGPQQSNVTYPASVADIANDLMPVWASQTDPSMLNLGVPYYGRGYTLGDAGCAHTGCDALGPSAPRPCLKDASGIMSLYEIDLAIGANGASVVLDQAAMQKTAAWGNQWVAYDDADTVSLKAGWADGKCIGGLIFWSVDFNSGAGS